MPPKIPALASLRFFAALTIVLFHLQTVYGYDIGYNAGAAVSLFFVLSGFVLTYRYPHFDNIKSISNFYMARLLRIWPLQMGTLLFFLSFIYFSDDYYLIIQHILLIQAWFADTIRAMSFNGVAWTISNEAFFYMLFPLVIVFRDKFLAWFALTSLIVVACIVLGNRYGLGDPMASGSDWASVVHIWPPVRFLEFLAGMGTAMLVMRFGPRVKSGVVGWTVVEAVALLIAAATVLPGIGYVGGISSLGPAAAYWGIYSAMFPAMALLIAVLAMSNGVLARVLSCKLLVFLGEISFSTYMWHQLVYLIWLRNGWTDLTIYHYGSLLLTIYIVSVLSFYLIEKPPLSIAAWTRARRGATATA